MLALTLQVVPNLMVPPISWKLLIDEVRDYVVTELAVPDDSALETVLRVQHALLPARGRDFPLVLELPHDYAAWHAEIMAAKDTDRRRDWPEVVPPLRSFGPATFAVDDADHTATLAVGVNLELHGFGANWEMDCPLARPLSIGEAIVNQANRTRSRTPAPA
jgi:hypothetical protein